MPQGIASATQVGSIIHPNRLINNRIKLPKKFNFTEDSEDLSKLALKIINMPNAGGASKESEALSVQVLEDLFDIDDISTEMEVKYWSDHWKKCDYVIHSKYDKENIAVSVTRFTSHPKHKIVLSNAISLYEKKLYGLVIARAGLMGFNALDRSILHILCRNDREMNILNYAWSLLSKEMQSDIQVIITLVPSHHNPIFINK